MLNRNVLVLNQNYEPLSVCSVKRAVILVYLGKAEIIEKHDGYMIRSVSVSIPLPSVVRLGFYIHVPHKRILLTRKNIIQRDGHRCQYCGENHGAMTVDHVIPKIYGGKDTRNRQDLSFCDNPEDLLTSLSFNNLLESLITGGNNICFWIDSNTP